jgi:phage terminase large subunit-like protein
MVNAGKRSEKSLLQQLKDLPRAEQDAMLLAWAEKAGVTVEQLAASLVHDWGFIGRPAQQPPPGNWKFWLIMTGRRYGKTRTAAEWVHHRVNSLPRGAASTGGLLQRTSADLRDIMIEGPSGLLATQKPDHPIKYEPSKRQVTFDNGYVMKCYCVSADTEALTPDGWVHYRNLLPGTLIRTFDISTGTARWSPAESVNVFPVTDQPMISVDMNSFSALVTEDHRWPVVNKETNRFSLKQSLLDFTTKDGVVLAAPPSDDLPETLPDSLVELVAWWTTEGTDTTGRDRRQGSITQSMLVNTDKVFAIDAALRALWGPPTTSMRGVREPAWYLRPVKGRGTVVFYLNHEAIEVLQKFCCGTSDKVVSYAFINSLSCAQRELFLNKCIDGDGWRRGDAMIIAQKVAARLDAIEYAAILNGWGVTRSEHSTSGFATLNITKSIRGTKAFPVGPYKYRLESPTYTGDVWCPTTRDGTWLARRNGTVFYTGNTAEEPDALRGPTLSTLWADEFASLKTVTGIDGLTAFDNALIALSAPVPGERPRGVITTTPRRVKSVKKVLLEAELHPDWYHVTGGSMYDNVDNLDQQTVEDLITKFGSTALGAQELDGLLVNDVEGASFKSKHFNASRIDSLEDCPSFGRVVIAVDPSGGDGTGDECGISVVAISAGPIMTPIEHKGLTVMKELKHIYVLEDASLAGPPEAWAARVSEKADQYGTTTIVAEGNQGGEMVKTVIRSVNPSLRVKVVHARVGKEVRAEPVAGLFAQGRAHLVGEQQEMEDQATTHIKGQKGTSPDRMDAMVHGVTFLEPAVTRSQAKVHISTGYLEKQVGAVVGTRQLPAAIMSPDSGAHLSRQIG